MNWSVVQYHAITENSLLHTYGVLHLHYCCCPLIFLSIVYLFYKSFLEWKFLLLLSVLPPLLLYFCKFRRYSFPSLCVQSIFFILHTNIHEIWMGSSWHLTSRHKGIWILKFMWYGLFVKNECVENWSTNLFISHLTIGEPFILADKLSYNHTI